MVIKLIYEMLNIGNTGIMVFNRWMSHQIHIAKKWTITHVRSTNSISHALLTFGLFYNYWFIGF